MKKLKLGMLLCFAVFLLGGCQIYSVVKDATDREEGRVVMKDGTEYVGRVKMLRISPQWYRCSGRMVPRGADAWYHL